LIDNNIWWSKIYRRTFYESIKIDEPLLFSSITLTPNFYNSVRPNIKEKTGSSLKGPPRFFLDIPPYYAFILLGVKANEFIFIA